MLRRWALAPAASLLFALPGCGTWGTRTVTTLPMGAGPGTSTDSGSRWYGAEPLGALPAETRPVVRSAATRPPPSPVSVGVPATPTYVVPTPAPVVRVSVPGQVSPRPPPPPPPAGATSGSFAMREPFPPPVREVGPAAVAPSPELEPAFSLPLGPSNPGGPVTDSSNLYAPPAGILPPPPIRRR